MSLVENFMFRGGHIVISLSFWSFHLKIRTYVQKLFDFIYKKILFKIHFNEINHVALHTSNL